MNALTDEETRRRGNDVVGKKIIGQLTQHVSLRPYVFSCLCKVCMRPRNSYFTWLKRQRFLIHTQVLRVDVDLHVSVELVVVYCWDVATSLSCVWTTRLGSLKKRVLTCLYEMEKEEESYLKELRLMFLLPQDQICVVVYVTFVTINVSFFFFFLLLQPAPCLALKTHRPAWSGACPPPTTTTRGTGSTEARLASPSAPTGSKAWTRGTRGSGRRTERGGTSHTSRTKRTGGAFRWVLDFRNTEIRTNISSHTCSLCTFYTFLGPKLLLPSLFLT